MGFKKLKAARRKMEYYSREFGFHQPYKILLDGNFIHATLHASMPHIEKSLQKLLGGKVRAFVSSCIHRELAGMGKEFEASEAHARTFAKHKCGHGKHMAAYDCLQHSVAKGNKEHWCVATQDKELYNTLKEKASVPVIFATTNGLDIAAPPGLKPAAAQQAAAAEADAPAVPQHEQASLAAQGLPLGPARTREKSIFRLNRAKAPNPLAVKKPQMKERLLRPPSEDKAKKRTRARRRGAAADAAAPPAAVQDSE